MEVRAVLLETEFISSYSPSTKVKEHLFLILWSAHDTQSWSSPDWWWENISQCSFNLHPSYYKVRWTTEPFLCDFPQTVRSCPCLILWWFLILFILLWRNCVCVCVCVCVLKYRFNKVFDHVLIHKLSMKSALPPHLFRAIKSHHGVCELQTPAREIQIQGFMSAALPSKS